VSEDEIVQIDLNDTLLAVNEDNERIPPVDELFAKLPKRGGKPYLSCFVLTHPDLDHCRGFADLLKRVVIGELWHRRVCSASTIRTCPTTPSPSARKRSVA
jgi:hypothetical protein